MKFEIKREPSKDIEILTFVIVDDAQPSIPTLWKNFRLALLASCFIVGIGVNWFCQNDFDEIEVQLKNDRSTTVILRSKDEQERNGTGSDGIAPTGH